MILNIKNKPDPVVRLDIEVLRFFSAIGIVWFHSGVAGAEVGYAGLIVFVVLSIWFSKSDAPASIEKSLANRAKRIIRPWLIWSLIFFLINFVRGKNFQNIGDFWFLVGGAVHLWYLPFIFFALTALDIVKILADKKTIFWFSVISVGVILVSASVWRPWSLQLAIPLPQYFHALFALFFGVMLLYARFINLKLVVVIIAAVVAGVVLVWDLPGMGVPYLVGAVLSLIVFSPSFVSEDKKFFSGLVRILGRHSFGLYLFHPIVFGVSKKLVGAETLAFPLLSVFISLLVVHAFYLISQRAYKILF